MKAYNLQNEIEINSFMRMIIQLKLTELILLLLLIQGFELSPLYTNISPLSVPTIISFSFENN